MLHSKAQHDMVLYYKLIYQITLQIVQNDKHTFSFTRQYKTCEAQCQTRATTNLYESTVSDALHPAAGDCRMRTVNAKVQACR